MTTEDQKRTQAAEAARPDRALDLKTMIAWFLIPICVSALCAIVGVLLWTEDKSITEENRLLENAQVVFLALAVAFHMRHIFRSDTGCVRLCHAVLGTLCLSVLVREIDIDKIGPSPAWATIELVIRLCLALVWLFLAGCVLRRFSRLWMMRFHILFSPASVLTAVAICFYLASWFFDKRVVPLPADVSQLWEELLQLSGTIFFFAASWRQLALPAHEVEQHAE